MKHNPWAEISRAILDVGSTAIALIIPGTWPMIKVWSHFLLCVQPEFLQPMRVERRARYLFFRRIHAD
jgi:hypothetical protein